MAVLSDVGAYTQIIIFSLIGLGFTTLVYFQNKLGHDIEKDLEKQLGSEIVNGQLLGNEKDQSSIASLKKYYLGITVQVQRCAMEFYKSQTFFMSFFALIFSIGFLIWLSQDDRTFMLMIAFALGCTCVAINTLITLKISLASVIRTAILSKEQSIIGFTYFNASAISIATTAVSILTLSILIPSFISILDDDDDITIQDYTNIFQSILGYALGTAFASLFYREAGSMSCKGILVGRDMIQKSNYQNYDQTVIEVNLNTASIISNIYNNNIVSVLDFQTVFTAFLCIYLIVICQSPQVDKDYRGTFYLPLYLVGINLLVAIAVTYVTNSSPTIEEEDNQAYEYSIPKETAKQVRLQVLICNIFSLVFLICFPIWIVPDGFTIGSKKLNLVSQENIDCSDAIWALMTGLASQTFLIVYSEVFTSHYFSPVKKIAQIRKDHPKGGFSMTLLTATEYANISQFGIFVLFSFTIMLGYLLCGMFGVACAICGLICSPFSLMSVNIFSGFTAEAFEISGVGKKFKFQKTFVYIKHFLIFQTGYLKSMRQKLFGYSWASRNFSIYTQIVTIIAVILTSVLCIGACVFITGDFDIYVWDAYGIFGFLYGGSLAYFIKGVGLSGIKQVAENLKETYSLKKSSDVGSKKSNFKEVDVLVKDQYNSVITKVAINIFTVIYILLFLNQINFFPQNQSIFSIVLIGIFFGNKTLVAFVIGLNLVGVYLCFMSLIVGYSVKNAREYSRDYGKVTDVDEAPIQADITVTACEGIPGTALVTYLVFNTVFVLQGAIKWAQYGYFRKWVDSGELNKLADSTTDGYLSSIKNIPDIISKAFDGEGAE
ncbi:hypothetical protein ABPG72_016077 [Tetrahymena utriculariae]